MDRISTDTKAVDLFGAGKHGWKNGNVGLGIVPTDFNAEWFNGVQEELLKIIESAGLVPDDSVRTQVYDAIKALCGGSVTTLNAANSPLTITAGMAGLIVVDATAGNVVANMPAVNAVTNQSLRYRFVRMDATANTATVNRVGADTFLNVGNSFDLIGLGDFRVVDGDSVSSWFTTSVNPNGGYAYLRDQKASGAGGGANSTGFQTRTINTKVSDTRGIVTLASNQMTLQAGVYRVKARAPGYRCLSHQLRLRNITAGATLLVGSGEYSDSGDGVQSVSILTGKIQVAAGQVLELQHYTQAVFGGGYGVAVSSGEVEVFSEIEFWKEV